MKITRIEDMHADGGWRSLSFLKISTDEGIVGWSEFSSGASAPGLKCVIRALGKGLIGADPRQTNTILARLAATTRMFPGGLVAQAVAAIDNACLDIKGKSLGIPVHDLFGGALRRSLPVYWSQCGTLRTEHADIFNAAALNTLDDVVALGKEVKEKGHKALKSNILLFSDGRAVNYRPGFRFSETRSSLDADDRVVASAVDLMHAFRDGAGHEVHLMLDLNFNFKPEGVKRMARALEPLGLTWLELDLRDAGTLAKLRQETNTPIASLESVLGCRSLRYSLDEHCVDIAIIDPQWNGMSEAIKMANLAETYDINVASHNYHGQLSTLIGAHFSASITNNKIVECVVDEAPWVREFYTNPFRIENGEITLPFLPGWGTDINEDAVKRYPSRFG